MILRQADILFRVQVTGKTDSSGTFLYDFTEQTIDPADGGLTDASPARTGVAREINNADVDVTGSPYGWAWLRGWYDGEPIYDMVFGSADAQASTITVTGYSSGNSPVTLSSIDTLNIAPESAETRTGVYVETGGTGIATVVVRAAGSGNAGLLTSTTQTIAGAKTFTSAIVLNTSGVATIDSDSYDRAFSVGSGGVDQNQSIVGLGGSLVGTYLKHTTDYTDPGTDDHHTTLSVLDTGTNGGVAVLFNLEDAAVMGWSLGVLSRPNGTKMMAGQFIAGDKFICDAAGTDREGVTGTLSLGALVCGGIIYDLGSGGSASNGQIYIGNGSGFTLATLTAGNGITITNGSGTITIAAATQMSLTADGSGLKLSGDSGSPGNNYFYGTDGSGVKGWYSTSGFGTTQEQVEDWVANLVTASTSINKSYNDGAGTLSLAVIAESSVEVGSGGVRLVGDTASPGNSKLYGTNGSGTRGWYDQPTGSYTDEEAQDAVGGILVDTDTINFTYDDGVPQIIADVRTQMSITSDATGVKLVSDASTPGNSKYYGTDSGGTKGFHSLPTSGLNYVTAPAYSDSSGAVNDYSYDATYVYLCVATNTWKRWAFDAGFLPAPP